MQFAKITLTITFFTLSGIQITVAQCSATPASVAATHPCSATPFQSQLDVRVAATPLAIKGRQVRRLFKGGV